MKVCGFFGASGAGKTTLMLGVIRELKAAGQRVSVIKHTHHGFDIDRPGKDSYRHREAGAFEVLIASNQRLALLREYEVEGRPTIHQLLAEMADVDWVLVEGFGAADILRVEVWRDSLDKTIVYPDDPFVVAIATDKPDALPEPTMRPVFGLADAAGVARHLLETADRHVYSRNDA